MQVSPGRLGADMERLMDAVHIVLNLLGWLLIVVLAWAMVAIVVAVTVYLAIRLGALIPTGG